MRQRSKILVRIFSAAALMIASACLPVQSAEQAVDVEMRVEGFAVYVPSNPADCDRKDPWAAGRWKLNDGGAVPSGGCLALNYTSLKQASVVLLHQGPDGSLTRLSPSSCELDVAELGEHWFPQARAGRERIVELDGEAGMERFHLLVIDESAGEALLSQLTAIPSFEGSCESGVVGPRELSELQALVASSESEVEWHIQSIEHY